MVGGDQVDYAVAQALPKRFAIFAAANRRRALELSCAARNFFRSEMEVVRASFDGHRKTTASGLSSAKPAPSDERVNPHPVSGTVRATNRSQQAQLRLA
jgi:hypothetical protein